MSYFFGWRFFVDLIDTTGQSHFVLVENALSMDEWQHFVVSYDRLTGVASIYRNVRWTPKIGQRGSLNPNSNPNDPHVQETPSA